MLATCAVGIIIHKRRTKPLAVRRYDLALRRSKIDIRTGETPRELLARVQQSGLDPDRIASLHQATMEHERARYTIQS